MRRSSIRGLMALVVTLAVGLAALRGANDDWSGGLLLATPLLLAVALIGALCGEGRSRAGRLGFAILGGAYFALTSLGLSHENLAKLPTSRLLLLIHERAAPPLTFRVTLATATTPPPGGANTLTLTGTPQAFKVANAPGGGSVTGANPRGGTAGDHRPPNRWRSFLPSGQLRRIRDGGHCLFALLAGLVGAAIARRFEGRSAGS